MDRGELGEETSSASSPSQIIVETQQARRAGGGRGDDRRLRLEHRTGRSLERTTTCTMLTFLLQVATASICAARSCAVRKMPNVIRACHADCAERENTSGQHANEQERSTDDAAPAAIGTYSQAVDRRPRLPVRADSARPGDDGDGRRRFRGARAAGVRQPRKPSPRPPGGASNDAVKLTIFLTDLDNFATVNERDGRVFRRAVPGARRGGRRVAAERRSMSRPTRSSAL